MRGPEIPQQQRSGRAETQGERQGKSENQLRGNSEFRLGEARVGWSRSKSRNGIVVG